MPRQPIDYSNTMCYKIVSNDLEVKDCYVGHTTNFRKRKNQHKTVCYNEKRQEYNQKLYVFIREHGGWDAFSMILLEETGCSSHLDALRRERELIEQLQATLNHVVPTRTRKEYHDKYYTDNKEAIHEKHRTYREENKDKLTEYFDKYRQENRQEICEQSRQHYAENKDRIQERHKEYYYDNHERLRCRASEKIVCEERGKELSRSSIWYHKQSKRGCSKQ